MGLVDASISGAFGVANTLLQQYLPLSKSAVQAHNLNVAETMRQEQRQEDFFNQYQSIPAQVRQMQEAGINPALAAGGVSAGNAVSGPSYSGAAPGSANTGIMAALDMYRALTGLRLEKQEMGMRQAAETREQEEHERKMRMLDLEIWRKDFDNAHYEEVYNTNREQQLLNIDKLRSDIDAIDANTLYTYTKQSKEEVERSILAYELFMKSIDAENHSKIVDAQLKYTEAQTKLLAASTAKERKTIEKLSADIRNLDADTAKKEIEKSNLSEEGKKLAIEADIAYRTQNAVVDKAFADLWNTDADTAKKAAEAMFFRSEFKSFDLERGKNEMKRAVNTATEATRATRTVAKIKK